MADRREIPRELADRVLYASDRQCCICRNGNRRAQIHHIDGDPGNNTFDNLAVICLDHHSEVHSQESFVRNLTPGLVRLYNDSWRSLVKLRLDAPTDSDGLLEYKSEIFLEFSLNCHSWKIRYMMLYPGGFQNVAGGEFVDVWDMMIEMGHHEYSPAEWKRYRPLFTDGIQRLLSDFDRSLTLYPEVIPVPFKTRVVRTRRTLDVIQRVYLYMPQMFAQMMPDGDNRLLIFKQQFTGTLQAIRDICREADRLGRGRDQQLTSDYSSSARHGL